MVEIDVEGVAPPRFRLFKSDVKHEPVAPPVCESDDLNEVRMYRRNAGSRYVLYDRRNRIPLDVLKVERLSNVRSAVDSGDGWYCKNPKCSKLIVSIGEPPARIDEVLVEIVCPSCHRPDYYSYSDFGWKNSKAR